MSKCVTVTVVPFVARRVPDWVHGSSRAVHFPHHTQGSDNREQLSVIARAISSWQPGMPNPCDPAT